MFFDNAKTENEVRLLAKINGYTNPVQIEEVVEQWKNSKKTDSNLDDTVHTTET